MPLLPLSVQAPTPPKPLLLALAKEPGEGDKALLAAPPAERDAKLKAGGYDVREFDAFLLVTPHDLLHLEAARAQTALLRAVARRAADGTHTVAAADLEGPDGLALRDLVRREGGWQGRFFADAPDLRIAVGVDTTFRVANRGRQLDFVAHPTGPAFGKDTSRMRLPDAYDRFKPPPRDLLRPVPAPRSTGRLTFLLPPGTDGTAGLERIAEAQAVLLAQAREARKAWTDAKAGLMSALKDDADGIYAHVPGGTPRFDDLRPELQYRWGTMFGGHNRAALGGADPMDWLRGARTLGVQTEPLLMLSVASGVDTATTQGTSIFPLGLSCPAGP